MSKTMDTRSKAEIGQKRPVPIFSYYFSMNDYEKKSRYLCALLNYSPF